MTIDVVVVGAGHAGIEAVMAAHRLGARVALVTQDMSKAGFMSCNPSIGGLGKGHIVREIDMLGGWMGRAADATCLQFKRLNSKKGPAVRGSRAQCDKELYSAFMVNRISTTPGLVRVASEVKSLLLENGSVVGVVLADGSELRCRRVVVTTGTFMRGVMHLGSERVAGGRVGEKAAIGLSDQLRSLGFDVRRLKTGTPPRLAAESIDWSKTEAQEGDPEFVPFSFRSDRKLQLPQVKCYLSHTNERTHEIIRSNLHRSPMFSGQIEGKGPRYCPSIEDKIVRFSEKAGHQTFLEPESLSTNSIYLQGISTSLPLEVQYEFLRTIPGLENVQILRAGYAVEYDFVEPTQIWPWLETKAIRGLFLAGQINGTSGYEEAAGQGLLAGANAVFSMREEEPLVLGRDQAYLGVLMDDLVTKGAEEPYRMFTSRAEHRLVLREDNVLSRLLEVAWSRKLLDETEYRELDERRGRMETLRSGLRSYVFTPTESTQERLRSLGTAVLQKPCNAGELLRREEIHSEELASLGFSVTCSREEFEAVEIEVKYEGYIRRQMELINQSKRLEQTLLPSDIDYRAIRGLSSEEVEKLTRVRPGSLGMAMRIPGVNPSGIQAILVSLKMHQREEGQDGNSEKKDRRARCALAGARVVSQTSVCGIGAAP